MTSRVETARGVFHHEHIHEPDRSEPAERREEYGPRSPEGKSRSRFNAVKHGMTAQDPAAARRGRPRLPTAHVDAWKDDLKPRTVVEEYLVERAAQVSWQLDRADRARPLGWPTPATAGADRVADLADEVLALGRRLFWDPLGPLPLYPHLGNSLGRLFVRFSWSNEIDDPNEPARIVNRLESTAIGCAWLLDRWGELRQRLDDGWTWQPPDRLKAIRLLGRQPMDAADDDRVMMIYLACWAMDPDGPHGFDDLVNELHPAELKLFIDRLDDRQGDGAAAGESGGGRGGAAGRSSPRRRSGWRRCWSCTWSGTRRPGRQPLLFDDSDSGERMRRYQLSGNRTLLRVLQTYYKVRREADQMTADPAPPLALPPDLLESLVSPRDESVQPSVDASLLFGPSDLTDLDRLLRRYAARDVRGRRRDWKT